jgi:hypothetical protein
MLWPWAMCVAFTLRFNVNARYTGDVMGSLFGNTYVGDLRFAVHTWIRSAEMMVTTMTMAISSFRLIFIRSCVALMLGFY